MRVIGYIRVSTAEQASDGASLSAQRQAICAWSACKNCEIKAIFEDQISGTKDARPGLQCAIDALEAGDALVVYSLSRLSRSVKHTLETAERLNKIGAELVSLSENLDTTTAAGKMIFRILAVFAEFERDVISDRTKAALQHKRRNGECVGRVPYGYCREGKKLTKNAEEQFILEDIVNAAYFGHSVRAIAESLNERGHTNRGNKWTHSAVHRLLQREANSDSIARCCLRLPAYTISDPERSHLTYGGKLVNK